jgi:hypothetical protein
METVATDLEILLLIISIYAPEYVSYVGLWRRYGFAKMTCTVTALEPNCTHRGSISDHLMQIKTIL